MSDFDVVQRGTDSSGRPVRATRICWEVWDACCDGLGFVPTIVQGGFMGDQGADASAGTHLGDAFDLRLWDRGDNEREAMIRVFRAHAFAYWERYESQGFDLHAHMVPGRWARPAPQAAAQWDAYLNGRNGLASNGPDYHATPQPIVTTPPKEDDMQEADFDRIANIVDRAIEARTDEIATAVTQRILGADLFPKREDIARTVREALTAASNEASRKGARDGKR